MQPLNGTAILILIVSSLLIAPRSTWADEQPSPDLEGPATGSDYEDVIVWESGHRIPGVVLTNEGTLVAFSEHRHTSADLGNNDLVCKRSTDGGKTWGEQVVIHEEGGNKPISIGDQCAVVDHSTGVIWCLFARNKRAPLYVISSADDGLTWRKPVEITNDVFRPGWSEEKYWFGPGHGIQLKSGRLLISAFHNAPKEVKPGPAGPPGTHTHVVYSDDHGETWKVGGTVGGRMRTTESRVVEFLDGSLCLNSRSGLGPTREKRQRAISWSSDGGLTWADAAYEPMLTEPRGPGPGCDGSVVLLSDSIKHDKSRVLYSGLAHLETRKDLAIHISYDKCKTWKKCRVLKEGSASYSDLVVLPDMSIGCIYETNTGGWQRIRFARFTLRWLTDGKDQIVSKR